MTNQWELVMLIDFLYETLIDLVLTGQLPLINLQAVSFENVLLPFCIFHSADDKYPDSSVAGHISNEHFDTANSS